MAFGVHFLRAVPEVVKEQFWEALNSGQSPTAAAAGVDGSTGPDWCQWPSILVQQRCARRCRKVMSPNVSPGRHEERPSGPC